MKISEYILTTVLLLCMACSPDQETYQWQLESMEPLSGRMLPTPENSDNPYDDLGRIYRAFQLGTNTGSALGIGSGQGGDATDPWTSLHRLSIGWGLSTPARIRFRDLVDTILSASYDSYTSFHAKMVTYEAHSMDDPVLMDLDKQFILTFASMIRYASYPEIYEQGTSGVEDEDWELSIPNAKEVVQMVLEHIHDEDMDSLVPSQDTGPLDQGQ